MEKSVTLHKVIQLVNDLCDYRDTYLREILDLDLFCTNITEELHQYLISSVNSLHDHLTFLIRRVVHASDLKEVSVEKRLAEVIRAITECENELIDGNPLDKAYVYYLKGKALNVLPLSNDSLNRSNAKLSLLNALKFNPALSDAWCELAELNWMEGEPEDAIAPLRSALQHDNKHSESLWRLSMLFRQLSDNLNRKAIDDLLSPSQDLDFLKLLPTLDTFDGENSSFNTNEKDSVTNQTSSILISVRLAYASVRASPKSGRAWECLGNALLTALLHRCSKSNLYINRCLGAFTQAVKDPRVAMEPHFHYNRGFAYLYEDNFSEALTSWFRASLLDPVWPAPRVYAMRLANALCEISQEISAFGHASSSSSSTLSKKQRRLQELIRPLSPCLVCCNPAQNVQNLSESKKLHSVLNKMIGPYFDKNQLTHSNSLDGASHANSEKNILPSKVPRLKLLLFNDLKIGSNIGSVCCGKVVSNLPSDSDLTLNLLISDAQGTLLLLRIYHIGQGQGPSVKDTISVPDPFVEECNLSEELLRLIFTFDSSILAEGGSSVDEVNDSTTDPFPRGKFSSKSFSNLTNINFKIIRVPTPGILCVNGRRVGQSWTAAVVLKNVFFTT